VIDLLFLAHNRLEFTRSCVWALWANTDWSLVQRVLLYDDGSTDGTQEFLRDFRLPVETHFTTGSWGSPVAVMNHAIEQIGRGSVLAKIDNDVMVPPGWLHECLQVMNWHPELDLLGIEAMYPVDGSCSDSICDPDGTFTAAVRSPVPALYIGGIGLMRTRAFQTFPEPQGRFGFTAWQDKNPQVQKAWLSPSLPVCLLDRVPFEPWTSLSAEYVAKGWQRPWPPYSKNDSALWGWWAK